MNQKLWGCDAEFTLTATLFLLGGVLCSVDCLAAKTSVERQVSLSGLYDDNPRLIADDLPNETLSGGSVRADLGVRRSSGRHSSSFRVNIDQNQYDDSSYNLTNVTASGRIVKLSERGSFGLNISARRDSVRLSELSEEGIGIVEGFRSSRSNTQSVSAEFARRVSEIGRVDFSASVSHQSYESERFRGYIYSSSTLSYQHSISARFIAQATLSYSVLDSDDTSQIDANPNRVVDLPFFGITDVGASPFQAEPCRIESLDQQFTFVGFSGVAGFSGDCNKRIVVDNTQKTSTARIGFIYQPFERMTIDFSVGQSFVDTKRLTTFDELSGAAVGDPVEELVFDTAKDSLSYALSTTLEFERTSISLDARTSENANSSGVLRRNSLLRLKGVNKISERFTATTHLDYLEQKSLGAEDFSFFDRENYRGLISFNYQMTKVFSMSLDQQYIVQNRRLQAESVSKNFTTITFLWRPSDWLL